MDAVEEKNCCKHCGQLFFHSELDENDLCEDCSEEFFSCDSCGVFIHENDVFSYEDHFYCERCYDNEFSLCEDCRESFHNDDLVYVPDVERNVCEGCYSDNYFTCDSCGCTYCVDDHGGDGLCSDCYQKNSNIYPYDYTPNFEFFGKGDLFFGIELEIENVENSTDNNDIAEDLPPFLYAKEDGSLNNGFEIVSHPLSWNWIQENKHKWQYVFGLKRQGFRSYDTDTCGIHVHLSKKAFSGLHLYKFLKLFYENANFIGVISRRKIEKLKRWASLETETSIVYKAKTRCNGGSANRYVAVNLENYNTVEVRIFRGTLGQQGFWLNLEFCKAAFDFSRNSGIKEITVFNFCEYVKNNKKEYVNLYAFLEKKDYVCNSIQTKKSKHHQTSS